MIWSHYGECVSSEDEYRESEIKTYSTIRQGHEVANEPLLDILLSLSANHVATGLVEGVDLLRRQVACDLAHVTYNLVNKRLRLAGLAKDKVSLALVGNLDESITSHVLDTLVGFVHEFEELIDDSLQELPMSLEEARVLADNVHDVTGDDSLVVLATLLFGQAEQIFDYGDEEALFRLLVHSTRNGSNGPAESIAIGPRPLGIVDLASQLFRHDLLRVNDVEMGEEDETFPGGLVELDGVALLDKLTHNLALVVFDNEDLFRTDHFFNHNLTQIGKDLRILVLPERVIGKHIGVRSTAVSETAHVHGDEWIKVSNG